MAGRGLKIRDDLDPAAMRRYARSEPDRLAALRALAIARVLAGASRAVAARLVGRERQSLRDAVRRYNAEGLAGLHDRPRAGPPGRLSRMQQEDLRAWVLRGPDPEVDGISSYRLRDIAARTRDLWGVTYTLSALSKLLRRMGLSWQKARPAHPKGDAEARELYKKPRLAKLAGKPAAPARRDKRRGRAGTGCGGFVHDASCRGARGDLSSVPGRRGPGRARWAGAAVSPWQRSAAPRRAAPPRAKPPCARLRAAHGAAASRTAARGRCWCAGGRGRRSSGTGRTGSCGRPCGSARRPRPDGPLRRGGAAWPRPVHRSA